MIFCGIIRVMENDSHPTQEAKVIPLAPYLNKKAMREAGRIVFRRLDTDAGESQPEPLARVYDISSRLPKPTTPEVTIEDRLPRSRIAKRKPSQKRWPMS